MRVTALVLGILGGLAGLVMSILALGMGGLNAAAGGAADTSTGLAGLGALGFVFSVVAFVGAGLSMSKPRAGALLLLVAGIGTLVSIGLFALFATPLELIGALLAFLGRAPRVKPAPAVTSSP